MKNVTYSINPTTTLLFFRPQMLTLWPSPLSMLTSTNSFQPRQLNNSCELIHQHSRSRPTHYSLTIFPFNSV